MSNELKDCPFCGSKPTLEDHRLLYSVDCKCGACVLGDKAAEPDGSESIAFWADIQQSAINKWNARSTPAVASGALPELPSGIVATGRMREYATEYGKVCYAMGRGAAVREYIDNGSFAAAAAPNAALVEALHMLLNCDGSFGRRVEAVNKARAALAQAGEVGK